MKPYRTTAETRIGSIAPKLGITDIRVYGREEGSIGMGTAMIRALKQLRDENSRLKETVGDLTLENAMLHDVIRTVVARFAGGPPLRICGRDGE